MREPHSESNCILDGKSRSAVKSIKAVQYLQCLSIPQRYFSGLQKAIQDLMAHVGVGAKLTHKATACWIVNPDCSA